MANTDDEYRGKRRYLFDYITPEQQANIRKKGGWGQGNSEDALSGDDMSTPINQMLREACESGGARCVLPAAKLRISNTIKIPQGVTLMGQGPRWTHYGRNPARQASSLVPFYELPKQLEAMVEIYYDPALPASTEEPEGEARHMGGIQDVFIMGMGKEKMYQAKVGVKISGVKFSNCERVHVTYCVTGFKMGGVSYSDGPKIQCNEVNLDGCFASNNSDNGFELSGGDSQIGRIMAGGNGGSGVVNSLGRAQVDVHTWDNGKYGFYSSAGELQGRIQSQDNESTGVYVSGDDAVRVNVSIRASSNGKCIESNTMTNCPPVGTETYALARTGVFFGANVSGTAMISSGNFTASCGTLVGKYYTQLYGIASKSDKISALVSGDYNIVSLFYTPDSRYKVLSAAPTETETTCEGFHSRHGKEKSNMRPFIGILVLVLFVLLTLSIFLFIRK